MGEARDERRLEKSAEVEAVVSPVEQTECWNLRLTLGFGDSYL